MSRERVLIDRDALAWIILGRENPRAAAALKESGLLVDHDEAAPNERADLWRAYGWSAPLYWYLWTRQPEYREDSGDPQAERRAALEEYRSAGPPAGAVASPVQGIPLRPCDGTAQSLGKALIARRSRATFGGGRLTFDELSELLTFGLDLVRANRLAAGDLAPLRSHGSAFDVHVVAHDVAGLSTGHYFYEVEGRKLVPIDNRDLRPEIGLALGGQPDQSRASLFVALVADFDRYSWLYRHERALRNLFIDAGRVMGRLLLVATALQLETGITPLLHDSRMRDALSLEPDRQAVVHTLTLSKRIPDRG